MGVNITSWNVNGIRAAVKKGLLEWMNNESADIVCLQEIKAQPNQLSEDFTNLPTYHSYWAAAEKRGYSGVCVYSKREALGVAQFNINKFDAEGRLLVLEYPEFTLLNGYFPNSQEGGRRLDYKLEYCDAILSLCNSLVSEGRNVLVCGDFNIAHKPIDLARPKENEKNPGYLPEERAWMDSYTGAGYVDTFRVFTTEGGHYSWWSYRTRGRERNIGWRLDYHCINEAFEKNVKSSIIRPDVFGSDHCPVMIELDFSPSDTYSYDK